MYGGSEYTYLVDHGSRRARDVREAWRAEDLQQQNLENARALWQRFVDQNRRDVVCTSPLLDGLAVLLVGSDKWSSRPEVQPT